MMTYFIIMAAVLGALSGSFLLVVSLRYNTGRSLAGRSMCFSCHKQLSWYELIPIFSYLAQRGRCRSCSSYIPRETLGAEILSSIIFASLASRAFIGGAPQLMFEAHYLWSTLYLMILFSLLIVIFLYDIRHKIIPDRYSLIFGVLSLISAFFFAFDGGVYTYIGFNIPELWDLFAGILVPLPFVLIWWFSKGKMMGLGDPKLMVGIGFLLGLSQGFSAVFVSFWIGTLFVLSLLILHKIIGIKLFGSSKAGIMKQEIPFGPFLIAGTLCTLVFNIQLLF